MQYIVKIITIYVSEFYGGATNFKGILSRKNYWMIFIINVIIALVLDIVSNRLYLVFLGSSIIPGIAAGMRRLNDSGTNKWFVLVPYVNLIMMLRKSKHEEGIL